MKVQAGADKGGRAKLEPAASLADRGRNGCVVNLSHRASGLRPTNSPLALQGFQLQESCESLVTG
jgi:hypothetical protein